MNFAPIFPNITELRIFSGNIALYCTYCIIIFPIYCKETVKCRLVSQGENQEFEETYELKNSTLVFRSRQG